MRVHALSVAVGLCLGLSSAHLDTQEYDYVVIGSGPGGGPLAANLARHGYSVLLLEAGDDHVDDPLTRVPIMSNTAAETPALAWQFFVNHYSDLELAQRDPKFTWRNSDGSYHVGGDPPSGAKPLGMLYPRGSTIGGSAVVNAAGLALPPDNDWEHIAELTGDRTWRAEVMRGYFERIEDNHYLPKGTQGHGFDGWLGSNRNNLSLVEADDGLFSVVGTGMTLLGDAQNPSKEETIKLLGRDGNSADSSRFEQGRITLHALHHDEKQRRSSPGNYIKATMDELHPNGTQKYPLTVSTNSLVTKLVLSSTTDARFVVGVEYLKGQALYRADPRSSDSNKGKPMLARAKKEVVLSAGAFNTPQLLKLSGIGPEAELSKFGIHTHVDLPAVGTNLQDNYEIGVEALASRDFVNTLSSCALGQPNDPCLTEFEQHGTGPYTQGPMLSLIMRSSRSENADADLWFFGGAASAGFRGFYPGWSNATAPPSNFWWSIVKMQAQNRAGTVGLCSADPLDTPEVDFNYFSEGREHDVAAIMEGVQLAVDAFNAADAPWAPFDVEDPPHGWEDQIMFESWGHHAACSCPMGVHESASCVDSRFKVHGIENLRVVDGSIFPRVPGGFPVLATFMISEKATDAILEDADK